MISKMTTFFRCQNHSISLLLRTALTLCACGLPAPPAAGAEWSATPHRIGRHEGVRSGDLADFNGDGRIDLLAVSPGKGDLVVFLQQLESSWTQYQLSEKVAGAIDVSAGDLNADGRMDAVITLREQGITGLLQQKDQDLPWMRVDIAGMLDFPQAIESRLTDLDGDGDLDIVFLNDTSGEKAGVYWAECLNPVNAFLAESWEHHQILAVPQPYSLLLADLAGDTRMEPFVGVRNDVNRFLWLKRPGKAGEEWRPQSVSEWPMPGPCALGDIDGDGQAFDLVSQLKKEDAKRPALAWSRFTGDGWAERQLIAKEMPPMNSLVLENLDDDPAMELVATAASKEGPGVLFLLDRGEEGWTSHVLAKGLGFPGKLLSVTLEENRPPRIVCFQGPLGSESLSNGVFLWEIHKTGEVTNPGKKASPQQAVKDTSH